MNLKQQQAMSEEPRSHDGKGRDDMWRLVISLGASAAASCANAGEAWVGVFGHDLPVGVADCCFEHGAD
ncbi:MAG TPA: hypothetical protein VGI79_09770, partial [Caulobacteraceae bacterium]